MSPPSTVQFQGRWDLEGKDKCITYWSGSSVHFQTTSRSVTVELGPLTAPRNNYHNILWRFGTQAVTRTALVKGNRSMVLTYAGAGPGSGGGEVLRDVTVMLSDWGATLQILDIRATEGRPILAPEVGDPVRPMLFIGDALVSGFSPLYKGLVLPHGSYQSFGSVVVRTLRALGLDIRLEMVALPGLRLVTAADSKGLEDVFWQGVDRKGGWDYRSKDIPNDIFVCIGTNDRQWGVDKTEFLQHYEEFLVRLRDSYSEGLKRMHVISPFGVFKDVTEPGQRIPVFEPDVQQMVEALATSWTETKPDGVKLYHVATDGWIDKSLTCDGVYPTTEGHDAIASRLIQHYDSLGIEGIRSAAHPTVAHGQGHGGQHSMPNLI